MNTPEVMAIVEQQVQCDNESIGYNCLLGGPFMEVLTVR